MAIKDNRQILGEVLNGKRKPNDIPGVGEVYINQSDNAGFVIVNGEEVPEKAALRMVQRAAITIAVEDPDKPNLPDLGWNCVVDFADGTGEDDLFLND